LSFVLSYKWCYNEKYEIRDGTLPWTIAHEIFSQRHHKPLHWVQHSIQKTGLFDQGVFANSCKRRWLYVEIFNNIRNIFSNYLVTKTGPMELNKRNRHSNFKTTISAMLCNIWCIISRNVSCLFPREKWG
jgi:hypothetical protein